MILKKSEPEFSSILAAVFSICLKESYFSDCWKVSSVVLYLRMLGRGLKTNCLVSPLSVVSKIFQKFVNNRLANHLKKCGLFSDFQYDFRYSTPVDSSNSCDKIARVFNRSRTTRAVSLDISKAFDKIWHAGLSNKQLAGLSNKRELS